MRSKTSPNLIQLAKRRYSLALELQHGHSRRDKSDYATPSETSTQKGEQRHVEEVSPPTDFG